MSAVAAGASSAAWDRAHPMHQFVKVPPPPPCCYNVETARETCIIITEDTDTVVVVVVEVYKVGIL